MPWGSASIASTRRSAAARLAARLTAVVVFPTPPFWLAIAIVRPKVSLGPPEARQDSTGVPGRRPMCHVKRLPAARLVCHVKHRLRARRPRRRPAPRPQPRRRKTVTAPQALSPVVASNGRSPWVDRRARPGAPPARRGGRAPRVGRARRAEGHRARRGAAVAVVAHAEDPHRAAGRAGRLAQEGPPPGPRLEQRHLEVVAQEGEDEPGGPVPRAHVDEASGGGERGRGEDVPHEEAHALGGRARSGQVDPRAPRRERVEVGGEARRPSPRRGRAPRGARGAHSPSSRASGAGPAGPAGATVTRRSGPSPTL